MLALQMLASNNNDKFLASVSFRLAIYLAFVTAIQCARKQTVNYNHLFRGQCFSPFPWPLGLRGRLVGYAAGYEKISFPSISVILITYHQRMFVVCCQRVGFESCLSLSVFYADHSNSLQRFQLYPVHRIAFSHFCQHFHRFLLFVHCFESLLIHFQLLRIDSHVAHSSSFMPLFIAITPLAIATTLGNRHKIIIHSAQYRLIVSQIFAKIRPPMNMHISQLCIIRQLQISRPAYAHAVPPRTSDLLPY